MKIGILQADSVLEQFQPAHGDYPAMIEDVLRRAAEQLDMEVMFATFDVEHGEYPPGIDDCDAYVITGSKKSVYDDEEWIHRLMDYVRELHDVGKPTIGLCFGHQLVAEALGGKTRGAAVGWGVGIQTTNVMEQRWFMDPPLETVNLIHSHKDQVVDLPPGAELLAGSDFCPNSMFCIGDHVFTVQGHPEFDRAYSSDLMHMREEVLGPETFETGVASLEKPLQRDDVARWIMQFIAGRKT